MQMTTADRPVIAVPRPAGEQTQRRIRRALAALWLFDGGLQLQPFMFSGAFVQQVLQPAAAGQPGPVAALVRFGAQVVGAQVGTWSMLFAALEIGIGAGLLYRSTVRPALWASGTWSAVVWVFGEGFGLLLTGRATLLKGAPGAALLYLLLTLLAWPAREDRVPRLRLAALVAWIVTWLGGAALQLLVIGQARAMLASTLRAASVDSPGPVANVQVALARTPAAAGPGAEWALAGLMIVIGAMALHRRTRAASLVTGLALALVMWPLTQSFGGVFTGTATDPGTAPLIALLGLACWRFDRSAESDWL
jgi:hypothetical protein